MCLFMSVIYTLKNPLKVKKNKNKKLLKPSSKHWKFMLNSFLMKRKKRKCRAHVFFSFLFLFLINNWRSRRLTFDIFLQDVEWSLTWSRKFSMMWHLLICWTDGVTGIYDRGFGSWEFREKTRVINLWIIAKLSVSLGECMNIYLFNLYKWQKKHFELIN